MEGVYSVLWNGAQAGEMRIYRDGLMTVIEAHCSYAGDTPFRLMVRSGGRDIPLGTMLPDAAGFQFQKRYSRQALAALGLETVEACWIGAPPQTPDTPSETDAPPAGTDVSELPADEADAAPSPPPETTDTWRKPTWQPELRPEELVKDPELRQLLCKAEQAISLAEGERIWLGVPLEVGKPFPLMPIFCLGRWEKINGKNYMVFQIRDGELEQ